MHNCNMCVRVEGGLSTKRVISQFEINHVHPLQSQNASLVALYEQIKSNQH